MPRKVSSQSNRVIQNLQDLGQKIRNRRKDLKISATDTSQAAEVSRVTLYRIEKGEAAVTMGAYLHVAHALGLSLTLIDPTEKHQKKEAIHLPEKIKISAYPQLKRLAWQLADTTEITPSEALNLYERNWRHINFKKMSLKEKTFLKNLLRAFDREKLLV